MSDLTIYAKLRSYRCHIIITIKCVQNHPKSCSVTAQEAQAHSQVLDQHTHLANFH